MPISVNEDLRPSRLVKSIPSYIKKSIFTIFRIFVIYKPFEFFISIGLFFFLIGTAIGVRFLVYFFQGQGDGHVQSLILASVLLGMGFQTILVAFIAELVSANRKLMEDVRYRVRKLEQNDQ